MTGYSGPGRVVAIHLAGGKGEPVHPVRAVRAVAGRGIEGDRYADDANAADPARQITLVEEEAVEAANAGHGLALTSADTRRNVVTRGVSLNHLVGVTFTVGDATLRGIELCEPCTHMAALAGEPRAVRALVHRGGLNAEIVTTGPIKVGDPVRPAQQAARTGPAGTGPAGLPTDRNKAKPDIPGV